MSLSSNTTFQKTNTEILITTLTVSISLKLPELHLKSKTAVI